jgi:hypothetical protein
MEAIGDGWSLLGNGSAGKGGSRMTDRRIDALAKGPEIWKKLPA